MQATGRFAEVKTIFCVARGRRRNPAYLWIMAAGTGLIERARACARYIAGLEEALDAERERRDAIIVEMRDAGYSWKVISHAIGRSIGRCSAIVAEAPGPVELTG